MWTSSWFPEYSKCEEKGLAELEPWGPMSIHERSWEGGWTGPVGNSRGKMRPPGAGKRQVNNGKAAPEVMPREGEETARAAMPTATPASQGALRRPRRSEEVEGPDRSVTQQPAGAQRWHLKGGACPRQSHNKEQGTGGHLGPKATLRVAWGKAPPLLCLWKINLGLKRRRVQFGKWGCRDGN